MVIIETEPENNCLILKIKNLGAADRDIKIILGERKSRYYQTSPAIIYEKMMKKKFQGKKCNDSRKESVTQAFIPS